MQSPNAGTGSLFECPGYLWFYREARRAEEVWSPAKATKRDKIGLGLKEATRPSPILPPKTRSSFVGQVMGADSQSRNFGSQERPVAGQEREEAMVRARRSDGSACLHLSPAQGTLQKKLCPLPSWPADGRAAESRALCQLLSALVEGHGHGHRSQTPWLRVGTPPHVSRLPSGLSFALPAYSPANGTVIKTLHVSVCCKKQI